MGFILWVWLTAGTKNNNLGRDWVLVLFSTVLSELVYIRPTVFISYTTMRVVCILFCSFCDHDMVTCSVVRVKSWSWKKKSWSWSWKNMEVLVLRPRVLVLTKKVLFTSLLIIGQCRIYPDRVRLRDVCSLGLGVYGLELRTDWGLGLVFNIDNYRVRSWRSDPINNW